MNEIQTAEIIAFIRFIPVLTIIVLGFKFKKYVFSLGAICFFSSIVLNVWFDNKIIAGAFSTMSAFAQLYILVDLITSKRR